MNKLFDQLSKILASEMPRRDALRLAFGGLAGSYLARIGVSSGVLLLWPSRSQAVSFCGPEFCGQVDCDDLACCCPTGSECCGDKFCCNPANAEICCGPSPMGAHTCCDLDTHCCCSVRGTGGRQQTCNPPPGFQIVSYRTAPPVQIEVAVRDYTGVGLSSISIVQSVNAIINIPALPPGTTYAHVTATRIDQTKPAQMILRACIPCGESGACCEDGDPVLTQLRVSAGKERVRESFTEIPLAEHFVTIQNGYPGLRKFNVFVNGQRAAYLRIGPKEAQTIDIAAAMTEAQNTITLVGQGRPGASALVLISDVPGPDAKGAREDSKYQPLVQWEPGAMEEGVNMRWGGGGADVM